MSIAFFVLGAALFAVSAADLWARPYQAGRVWQSFDIIAELERAGGVPWETELSSMSGGREPAPFIQEFPIQQYAALLLRRVTAFTVTESGQLIALLVALFAILVIFAYARMLPAPWSQRLTLASAVLFIPGFLRYGPMAVPDMNVFLLSAAGAASIFAGRRRCSERLVVFGAVLIGLTVLAKATALIPALVVAGTLLYEKRRTAAAAFALAALPGLAWAVLATRINPGAASVNHFARLVGIREYWWNPALYLDPWWYRNLAFLLYDTLGVLGITAITLATATALKNRQVTEAALLVIPGLAMSLAFNYHTASHGYYHLVWLPLSLVTAIEVLAAKWRRAVLAPRIFLIAGLALVGVAERVYGLVERISGHPEAARQWLATSTVPGDQELRAGIRKLAAAESNGFVAYFGDADVKFHELGIRGWIVHSPNPPNRHLPARVIAAEEWRRVGPEWVQDRIRRGLTTLLVEQRSQWNNASFLETLARCGLEKRGVLAGHLLFSLPR
ncbi:MAG TPA: hypothetical protein VN442_11870 [Bryobacteraceae bacterium]|nr:hypothetical protein [Bryobacteraceae bacterium]